MTKQSSSNYTYRKRLGYPNGETAIVPKDDGTDILLSAFQSREFGFGLEMSKQDLELVNEYRKDKNYQDGAAAKEKRGDIKKKHLLKVHLYLNLNMVLMVKAIGYMSTWCSS